MRIIIIRGRGSGKSTADFAALQKALQNVAAAAAALGKMLQEKFSGFGDSFDLEGLNSCFKTRLKEKKKKPRPQKCIGRPARPYIAIYHRGKCRETKTSKRRICHGKKATKSTGAGKLG